MQISPRAVWLDRWVVTIAPWAPTAAGREGEIVRHEVDERGRPVVRVRFLGDADLFEPYEATFTVWEVLPARPHPDAAADAPVH